MCRLLKPRIIYLIPLFIMCSTISANSQEEQNIDSLLPEIFISEQCKNLLDMNLSLKANLLMFLHYDSCGNSKARDYKGMYALFSKDYLTAFSNIQSAEEYEKRMLDSSEIYHTVYLLIKHVEFIKNDVVKIGLQFESGNEGVLQIMEKEIIFKNENGSWKYDGPDVASLKVIKTLEE